MWPVALLAVLALVASACGGTTDDSASFDEAGGSVEGDESGADAATAAPEASEEELFESSREATDDGAPPDAARDTTLNAGSIDDNERWEDYLLYRQEFDALGIPVSEIDVAGRRVLEVVDGDGSPVLGAEIEIVGDDGTATSLTTYSDGRALFHAPTAVDPDSQDRPTHTARVTKGAASTEVDLDPGGADQRIVLEGAGNGELALDVLFLVDATGSMADEIERLKANMVSISEQIAGLPGEPDTRLAMTTFRDRGEDYVVDTVDFTSDVDGFVGAIGDVVADGGGDTPESLGAALDEALAAPSWRSGDAVKLVVLVGDAGPHLPGEPGYEDEPDYADAVREAAARGVKILPIASSGLDAFGEYVFRQLAQVTMGRLVFLTYGADGSTPGTSTPLNVDPDDYDVLSLDALVVQLAADELAPSRDDRPPDSLPSGYLAWSAGGTAQGAVPLIVGDLGVRRVLWVHGARFFVFSRSWV
ncbi:MAG: vWA domain-containing protein [Acidimicrobiia bacterium]|nr:vWA domain-containing protein [Acidimicrobiia bacterium]